MLNHLMSALFSVALRIVLALAGLVFLLSLLFAALVLLALWSVRALWSRLTGRPVARWTFKVDRQAVWNRFYRAPSQNPTRSRVDVDVIDVEVKESRPR
jgi:hypothetical protein